MLIFLVFVKAPLHGFLYPAYTVDPQYLQGNGSRTTPQPPPEYQNLWMLKSLIENCKAQSAVYISGCGTRQYSEPTTVCHQFADTCLE